MAQRKFLIIANCPEKFKIADFNNFSRIPLCSSASLKNIQYENRF